MNSKYIFKARNGKNTNNAPFGVQIQRFATIGFHPGLDPQGFLQKARKSDGGLGPGCYNIKYRDCWCKKESIKEPWTVKLEAEEFSRMLGFRNARILEERKEMLKANGPGTIDVSENLFKQQTNSIRKNVLFGTVPRFRKTKKASVPPPGTHGKNHDPYLRYEESCYPRRQWTPLPTFEWDSFINRFKVGRHENRNSLPPNRYKNIHLVGIDQTIAKRITKRGPYDCFTGPRDNTTIKGYFAPKKFIGPKSWPTAVPGEIDRLFVPNKKNYGKFLRTDRFTKHPGLRLKLTDPVMCTRDPDDPGPCHYCTEKPREYKENISAFNSSVLHPRPTIKWAMVPGVGRYNFEKLKCKHKENKESWVFKSKGKREFYKVITYNAF